MSLTPRDIASMLDHSTLQPFLTEDDIRHGAEVALKYHTASMCARPCDVPIMAELLRGKCGRIYGDLMQLLTVMKGTPLAYNKDFQEDKEGVFDAIDTWKASVAIFAKMLENTEFRLDKIEPRLKEGFLNATDIAEHMAAKGIPFREAHNIVGRMVQRCEEKGCQLEDLTDEDLTAVDERINKEMLGDISVAACVDARDSFGGTAPHEVERQIEAARKWLDEE